MFTSQNFRALYENASIGIVVINSQGKIVLTNNFLLKQFGYEQKDLIEKEIEILIPERFKVTHQSHRSQFLQKPQNRPMGIGLDLYAITKSGVEIPVEVSLTHYTSDGQSYVAAYITDISQRKTTENAIRTLNIELEKMVAERTRSLTETVEKLNHQIKEAKVIDNELQKVNVYLKSIWNYAGAIMIATNKNGIIELFNPAAEQYLGYSASEVIGKHTPLLFHDQKEIELNAKELSNKLNRPIAANFEILLARTQQSLNHGYECNFIKKDGKRFPVDLTITTLQNGDHFINGYLEIAIDISDRKKAEAELRSALQKEKELSELKSRFVSIASHEFRTPLSTILSSAYLISQYQTEEEQEKRNKHIERIASSVNMLSEILSDFLSIGKIEEGRVQVNKKEFNIKKHTEATLADLQGIRKKDQLLNYKHSGDEIILTDPAILKHIIINLVSNAIKFSPNNASIDVKTENSNLKLKITVKDHGIGIPEEDQQHLFELFYRASNVTNYQGTGLGLHIIKRYTELLNGEIHCRSKEGEGTEFEVIINL